jgi:ubiquinone/menaquinone biosynthesis C-methylase UbiE
MKRRLPVLLLACAFLSPCASAQTAAAPVYETRTEHDPFGTGKFYMGREIALVMGHQGADWLDRPGREQEDAPSRLMEILSVRKGDVVADVGAGTGYFTFRLAKLVGPAGKVFATDIQPEMLAIVRARMKESGVTNIETVLGAVDDPKLPTQTFDLILLVDVYHELEYPKEMALGMVDALKPDGRLVLVEYRLEDPKVAVKTVHKMSEKQMRKEMAPLPLDWVATIETLPRQHVFVFEKHREDAPPTPTPRP